MQLHHPETLPPGLSPAEFEQLARDVFALGQRDCVYAEIDVAALTGKTLNPAETAQILDLIGLYFAEVATRAVDAQTAPKPFVADETWDWMRTHLRPAA